MSSSTFVLFGLLFCCGGHATDGGAQVPDEPSFEVSADFDHDLLPDTWYLPPYDAVVQPVIDPDEAARSIAVVLAGLTKYPTSVLYEYLSRVQIVGYLRLKGARYGGTMSGTQVFIVNAGLRRGSTDWRIEQGLHHEFSSVLYWSNSSAFPREMWAVCCPAGFSYTNDPDGAIISGEASGTWERDRLLRGFLCQYAQTSMENDFNMIAAELFMNRERFWLAVDQYPLLARKVDLAIEFYGRIDSSFTLDYFKCLPETLESEALLLQFTDLARVSLSESEARAAVKAIADAIPIARSQGDFDALYQLRYAFQLALERLRTVRRDVEGSAASPVPGSELAPATGD